MSDATTNQPDNVVAEAAAPVTEAKVEPVAEPAKPTLGPNSMLSAREAADVVMGHFQRQLKLQVRFPPQIYDGCAVEFFDTDLPSITYASARLRIRNTCVFDAESGELKLTTSLSDLAMKK
jgi:hypothetical protein